MSLNIRTEELDNRRISLILEVDQDRVETELRKAARKVSGQYRIPGFRRGKAPYDVVVQYVGKPSLYQEFLDELGNELYPQAIEQAEVVPYAMASLDIDSLEPLVYKFEVPLEPIVDLGDYRALRVEEEPVEVTDEEVTERIDAIREQMAGWTEVDRPSQFGDMLTIDVRSVLQSDEGDDSEEETVVLDETDWDVTLDEENPMEPEGLDEYLINMSPGEKKEFSLHWPDDSQSIYAGKTADFKVVVHKIQANLEPELNDEFAKKVDEEYETVEDLTASIREDIEKEKEQEAKNAYMESVLDALVEQSDMEYPPVVVEDQIDSMVNEFNRQLQMYGLEGVESYLTQTGMTMEDYRDTLREQAEIAAVRNLAISELYQKEGITATDEEVEERIEAMYGSMGEDDEADEEQKRMAEMIAENLRSGPSRPILESQIIQEKALERLAAIARGEEVPDPVVLEEATEEAADEVATDSEADDDATTEVDATEIEAAAEDVAADEDAAEETETVDAESVDAEELETEEIDEEQKES